MNYAAEARRHSMQRLRQIKNERAGLDREAAAIRQSLGLPAVYDPAAQPSAVRRAAGRAGLEPAGRLEDDSTELVNRIYAATIGFLESLEAQRFVPHGHHLAQRIAAEAERLLADAWSDPPAGARAAP